MRSARLLALGWFFQLKMLWRDPFTGFFQVLYPMFFATVAFLMFRAGADAESLLYAALGAGVMGIWAATSTTAGSAMQRERWHGTLEVLVASPSPFALILLPVTVAMSTIGLYCMVATLVWGRVLFVGGGPSCQLTYREYLTGLLAAMGIRPLPEHAFSGKEWARLGTSLLPWLVLPMAAGSWRILRSEVK